MMMAGGVARNEARADPAVTGIAIASAALFGMSLFLDTPKGDEKHFVTLEGGRFDVLDRENEATEGGLEFRPGWTLWKFRPIVGARATTDETYYVYAGGRFDVYFGHRFVVSPSFALAYYHKGEGKDLGSEGVGRSGIDMQYRFDNDMRLGVGFHHMSHGKIMNNDFNPGTETLGLTFSVPFGNR
jgi:hypothetical protein